MFAAIDQNEDDDRKFTLGYGFENQTYFIEGYASAAITDERFVGVRTTSTSVTNIFEHPYDYGVGFRAGKFFDESLIRIRGGLDYEWGDEGNADADQIGVSLSGEKFFHDSPHSLALNTEYVNSSGNFEDGDNDDFRVRLLYRYSLGESYRPTRAAAAVPPPQRVVRNDISLDTDAFFDLDRSTLRPDAMEALNQLTAQLQNAEVVGNVQIVGHTCDLGSVPYNQRLSERRAASVRDYLISKGFDPATLEAEGRGELEPKFPNDGEANRRKNRRVDIVAMTMEEIEQPAPGPIQISSEPAWIQRALRNPAEHKRTVDVYRIDDRHNINNGPPAGDGSPDAVDDNVTINQDSGATVIDVLANDSDPNGDTLTIVSVTSPANGSVINNGTSVTYTPNPGFNGIDTFTYTIDDGNGNTDTATVTVNVSPGGDGGNNPPDAVDDNAVTNRNTPVTIDVLANDSDPDGDPLVVSAVTQPTVGSVVNNGSNVTFTPRRNFRGTVTFTYTAADGRGGTDTATVTVDIPIY